MQLRLYNQFKNFPIFSAPLRVGLGFKNRNLNFSKLFCFWSLGKVKKFQNCLCTCLKLREISKNVMSNTPPPHTPWIGLNCYIKSWFLHTPFFLPIENSLFDIVDYLQISKYFTLIINWLGWYSKQHRKFILAKKFWDEINWLFTPQNIFVLCFRG